MNCDVSKPHTCIRGEHAAVADLRSHYLNHHEEIINQVLPPINFSCETFKNENGDNIMITGDMTCALWSLKPSGDVNTNLKVKERSTIGADTTDVGNSNFVIKNANATRVTMNVVTECVNDNCIESQVQ